MENETAIQNMRQEIKQLEAGMEQGLYSTEEYAKLLLEIILKYGLLNLL